MLAGVIGLRANGSRWAARVLTVTALGMLMAGVFVTDPGLAYPADAPHALPAGTHTWHGLLHGIAGAIVFFSLPIATGFTAAWFARQHERAWMAYSLATLAIGFTSFMVAMGNPDGPAGVYQRITIITYFTWFSLVALHFAQITHQQRRPQSAVLLAA
jgi:hypothetical protein